MANLVFNELKEYYLTHQYADITLKISEAENNTPPVEIKAHRIILAVNSPLFKRLIAENELEKGNADLKLEVNQGELEHVKIIVSSFYDKSVIYSLSSPDLISVLELSFKYASANLVEEMCPLLEKLEPDFKTSNLVLRGIHLLDQAGRTEEDRVLNVKLKYTKYLAEYFCPVEERCQTHTDFMDLNYGSLWCLLDCGCNLSRSENALLTLVLEWFKQRYDRQTAEMIKGLLEKIRVKYLNAAFLHEIITLENEIFNNWNGFHKWMCDCLSYLARSAEERKRLKDIDDAVCRNRDLQVWFQELNQKREPLCAVRWMVRMTSVEESERFEPTPHLLVHDRIQYYPESITTVSRIDEKDGMAYNLTLRIRSSFPMLGLQFVLGIVPADREYDMSKMYFRSNFAKLYLLWTDSSTEEGKSMDFSFWSASREFIASANQHGLYACILPFTKDEYNMFCRFKFHYCPGYSPCEQYKGYGGVYSGCKINLVPSSNFSE